MISSLLLLLAAGTAHAVPTQMNHQGRLLDSVGTPLQGVHLLEFRLYDAPTGGALVWSEQQPVDLTEGFYTVELGADVLANPLDDATLTNPNLFLSLKVDGGQEMARAKVSSVPYARLAGSATSLMGGPVDAAEVRVGGTLVIDATGNWVGPGGTDTLQSLNCLIDEVAVYDGAAWGCAALPSADWNTLLNMPADFMDGVDNDTLAAASCGDDQLLRYSAAQARWTCGDDANTTLSDADVIAIIANNPVTLHPATTVQWGAVASKPPGFADNIDDDSFAAFSCADGLFLSYSGGAPTCASATDTLAALSCANGDILAYGPTGWDCATDATLTQGDVQAVVAGMNIGWAQLTGIPGGLNDGDDDTLATLNCPDGQIVMYSGGTPLCASPPSDTLTGLSCADGELVGWNNTSGAWECMVDADSFAAVSCPDGQLLSFAGGSPTCAVDADSFAAVTCPDGQVISFSGGSPTCAANTDNDTLAATACANGEILAYSTAAGAWACASDTDTTLTNGEVQGIIALTSIAWSQLVGVPADLADGSVSWTELTGKPAGFADGVDDDYLASLVCADGEIVSYDQGTGTWVCDFDAVLGALEVLAYVNGSDIDLGPNTTLNGTLLTDLLAGSGAITEADMPFNGLNEVSNDLLSNQYIETTAGGGEQIPDNNPIGVYSTVNVPDVGIAEWLNVTIDVANSDTTQLFIELIDPDGTHYVLYDHDTAGTGVATSYPDVTVPLTGDLTTWVGRNPVGAWSLHVIDDGFLNNAFDGQVNSWDVTFQHVSNNTVTVQGALAVDADLNVTGAINGSSLAVSGGATVGGDLAVGGSVQIGTTGAACSAGNEGSVRYVTGKLELCDGSAWGPLVPECPADMINMGGYCIDAADNTPASWQAQANKCQAEGKRMCSLAEWVGACNSGIAGLNEMLDGNFEYVDEYWVMDYLNGNYYSAYVSAGATSCGRIYYSGWACANSSCYDTTAVGGDLESRCCL